jgi:hypothetical protein
MGYLSLCRGVPRVAGDSHVPRVEPGWGGGNRFFLRVAWVPPGTAWGKTRSFASPVVSVDSPASWPGYGETRVGSGGLDGIPAGYTAVAARTRGPAMSRGVPGVGSFRSWSLPPAPGGKPRESCHGSPGNPQGDGCVRRPERLPVLGPAALPFRPLDRRQHPWEDFRSWGLLRHQYARRRWCRISP